MRSLCLVVTDVASEHRRMRLINSHLNWRSHVLWTGLFGVARLVWIPVWLAVRRVWSLGTGEFPKTGPDTGGGLLNLPWMFSHHRSTLEVLPGLWGHHNRRGMMVPRK